MPKRPPKEWFDKMETEVREGNPDYSEETVRKTVGDIWYNKMSPSKKKKETKKYEGSRVEASPRVSYRVPAVNKRVAVSVILDLFSSGGRKYIVYETQNRAAEKMRMGPGGATAAIRAIEEAQQEVIQEVIEAVPSGVSTIIDEEREDILSRMNVEDDAIDMAEPAAPQMVAEPPVVEDQGGMEEEVPVAPPGASLQAQTQPPQPVNTQQQQQQPLEPEEPAEAVDNSQDKFPQLIVDGPAGEEQIPVGDMDLQYLNAMIDQMASGGGQVSFAGTMLEGKVKNDKAWYMDIDYGTTF